MPDKKLTTEELAKQVAEAKKVFDRLNEQLQKQKQEEDERKQAELALKKDMRQKEVENALKNYEKLFKEFLKDYGAISITSDHNDWFPFFRNGSLHWWLE